MLDIKYQTLTAQQLQQLRSLLEDTSVVKVLYDAGAVAAELLRWEGLAICNVFDIQVAPAASLVTCYTAPCVQPFCIQILSARSFSSLCTECGMSSRFCVGCMLLYFF